MLIGIGITAMLDAVVAYLLTRAKLYDAQRATVWLTGSLNGRGWEYVRPLTIALAVLLPLTLIPPASCGCSSSATTPPPGWASACGAPSWPWRSPAPALAAVATAAAGPVGFVALVAPQIARRLTGERSAADRPGRAGRRGASWSTPTSLARRVFAPTELPVGVVTAIIGAPYLLWLLARANRIGSGG